MSVSHATEYQAIGIQTFSFSEVGELLAFTAAPVYRTDLCDHNLCDTCAYTLSCNIAKHLKPVCGSLGVEPPLLSAFGKGLPSRPAAASFPPVWNTRIYKNACKHASTIYTRSFISVSPAEIGSHMRTLICKLCKSMRCLRQDLSGSAASNW